MMKQINQQSAAILCQLVGMLKKEKILKLESTSSGPIVLEKLVEYIKTEYGAATLLMLSRCYSIRGRDVYDPVMQLLLVNDWEYQSPELEMIVLPVMHQTLIRGVYEYAVLIFDLKVNTVFYKVQARQAVLAERWLAHIVKEKYSPDKK